MALPRKKLKLTNLTALSFDIQGSPYLYDSNSNSDTPNYHERSIMSDKSNFSIFKCQNPMTTSIETMSGFIPNCTQSANNSSQNILETEQFIVDESNDIEMRINEWLDNQNIVMVSPEDIIHDFYQKIRAFTIRKMEIELNEFQMNEESAQSSLTDLDYESLDYSHERQQKKLRKAPNFSGSKQKKDVEIEASSQIGDRNRDLPIISSLLKRRQNDNKLSITGITTNRYQY